MKIIRSTSTTESFAFARNAMATRFEIVLPGDDAPRLRAVADEAFGEIERIEARLSPFRPTSEISHLNARAAHEAVRVSCETFQLLQRAARLSAETGGAFDITVGPLMRAWGFVNGSGYLADRSQLAAARACVGMNLLELDARTNTVRFKRSGVALDLGAIGKGYAVERAAELLRETGINSALIHGGTSTIYAIGEMPDGRPWKIAVENPRAAAEIRAPLLARVELRDEALSMSAAWGKSFSANGKNYGHILDARAGEPANTALLAVVVARNATESDALSTALFASGLTGMNRLRLLRPDLRAMVLLRDDANGGHRIESAKMAVLSGS